MAHWWSGSDTTLIFENPEDFDYVGREHHIVIANHKYDIDWLAMWMLAERAEMLGVSTLNRETSFRVRIYDCSSNTVLFKYFTGHKNLRQICFAVRSSHWMGLVLYGKYFLEASVGL